MINERLFGAPIPLKVQNQLDEKQQGFLSEKIPFIRMWVAPKLVAMEELVEKVKITSLSEEQILQKQVDRNKALNASALTDNLATNLPETVEELKEFKVTTNQVKQHQTTMQGDALNTSRMTGKQPSVDDIFASQQSRERILALKKNLKIRTYSDENSDSTTRDENIQMNAQLMNFDSRTPDDINPDDYPDDDLNTSVDRFPKGPDVYPTVIESTDPVGTDVNNVNSQQQMEQLVSNKVDSKKVETITMGEKISHGEIPYEQSVYLIGDYGYQTGYKSYDINKPLSELNNPGATENKDLMRGKSLSGERNINSEVTETGEILESRNLSENQIDKITEEVFPNELKNNPLLKPVAGITSMTSETAGTLGVIKKTTVNFIVHNFEDFDRIYNRYFLKPGTSIFVDFGWNDAELYDPNELIEKSQFNSIEHFLYNEPEKDADRELMGVVTKNQGKLEVIQGIVTDYNAKVLNNGSVECSVTLTSSNSALLSFKNDSKNEDLINFELTSGIYKFGLKRLIEELPTDTPEQKDLKETLLKAINQSVAYDSNRKSVEAYQNNLKYLFFLNFGLTLKKIPNTAVEFGFFIDGLEAEDCYISWGRVEDLIINSNYGFGIDANDVEKGMNFNVRMDSSLSYTTFSKLHARIQKTAFESGTPPDYFFPPWWGNSNPDGGDGSYSWKKGKYAPNYLGSAKFDKGDTNFGKIPLREVFINMKFVKEAFKDNKNKNITAVMKSILKSINDASDGLFDWHMKIGSVDSKIEIIDKNYSFNKELNQKINSSEFPFYTFNIMSPNSIVKDYNLEFKLPQGDIGSMYAIRGQNPMNNIFSTEENIRRVVGIEAMDSFSPKILQFPDYGNHRAASMVNDTKDNGFVNIFNRENDLIGDDLKTLDSTQGDFKPNNFIATNEEDQNLFDELLNNNPNAIMSEDFKTYNPEDVDEDVEENKKQEQEISINNNNLHMEKGSPSHKVYSSLSQYYKSFLSEKTLIEVPRLLPYTLSLSIHGISSVVPGDVFKVDYLPQMYLDKTYLQIMKVSHQIDGGNWTTSFDTQFREIFPDLTNDIFKISGDNRKVVSAAIFTQSDFDFTKIKVTGNFFAQNIGKQNPMFNQKVLDPEGDSAALEIDDLAKYMMYVKPLHTLKEGSALSHIFEFEFNKEGVKFFVEQTDNDFPGLTFNTMMVNLDDSNADTLTSQLKSKGLRVVQSEEPGTNQSQPVPIPKGSITTSYEKQVATKVQPSIHETRTTNIKVDALVHSMAAAVSSKYHENYIEEEVEQGNIGITQYVPGLVERKKYTTLMLPPFSPKRGIIAEKYHMWVRNSQEFAILPAPGTQDLTADNYATLKEYFENGDTIKLGNFEVGDLFKD